MTGPADDLLTTTEGVDEGSADSTAESARAADVAPTATDTPTGEGTPADRPATGQTPSETSAPPLDMESAESRAVREARGTGQQLSSGEGGPA